MVFGWGKKKQRESEIQGEQPEKAIKLSDVKDIVKKTCEIKEKLVAEKVKNHRKQSAKYLSELVQISQKLEKDDLKTDDVDKHLRTVVMRGKNLVISVIKKEATQGLIDVKSFDDAVVLSNNLSQILKKIGDVLGRQTRVIHIFAKKYADRLKNILTELNAEKDEIILLVNSHKARKILADEVFHDLEKIKKLKNVKEINVKKISKIKNNIEKLTHHVAMANKKLEQIKSSNEYLQYLETQNKIKKHKELESEIKDEVDQQFTKISRPMGKYEYVSSLDKPLKLLLQKLSQEPFSILSPENKDDIVTILESARKSVASGTISIKDTEKSLAQIDETVSLLDGFIEKKSNFSKEQSKLKDNLKKFDSNSLKNLKKDLEKSQRDISDFESKIKELEKEILESQDNIPAAISSIEKKLEQISKIKYKLSDFIN